jgi:uncharacterized protein (DUF302 family)
MIRTIEVERFSLISSKPFDQVVAVLYASIGHPDMAEFGRSTHEARSFAELKSAVEKGLSTVGLMLFMQLDHGAILRKETGRETPKMIRFVIGNPLIMKEMVKHVPDAGSYAPVTVLVDERADGVHLSYDRMASFLAPYGNRDALEVARDLDKKIEDLLRKPQREAGLNEVKSPRSSENDRAPLYSCQGSILVALPRRERKTEILLRKKEIGLKTDQGCPENSRESVGALGYEPIGSRNSYLQDTDGPRKAL